MSDSKDFCTLFAYYQPSSHWHLNFNLKDCFDWYVTGDILYVQKFKNEEYIEFYPDLSACMNFDSFYMPAEIELI